MSVVSLAHHAYSGQDPVLPSRRHWLLVIVLAVLVHISLAGIFLYQPENTPQGVAQHQGIGGVEIGLGKAVPATQVMQRLQKPQPPQPKKPESPAERTPEPKTAPVEKTPATPTQLAEKQVTVTRTETTKTQRPELNRHKTETAAIPLTPKPGASQSLAEQPAENKNSDAAQKNVQQPEQQAKPIQNTPDSSATSDNRENTRETMQPARKATEKQQAIQGGQSTGSANQTNGGQQGAVNSYMADILQWLNRFKRYPNKARRKREGGIAYILFEMQRDGEVTLTQLHRSSGSATLDRAAEKLLLQASPLPPVPDDIFPGRSVIRQVLPINYSFTQSR